jgi:hypothetical protein
MATPEKGSGKSGTIPPSNGHRRGRSFEDKAKLSEKADELLFSGSLFNKSADDTRAEYFGSTAADFILRTLLTEFKEHTQGKIEEIMKFGIVCGLYIFYNFSLGSFLVERSLENPPGPL